MTFVSPGTRSPRPADAVHARDRRSADAATILGFFVVLQFVLPSRLVLNYLPLSLSAASMVALGLGALWLCTQMTMTLGAAKGWSPVRTLVFAYSFVLLASYARAASGYLPRDEREMGDHAMVTVFALVFVALAACDGIRSRERLSFLLRVVVVCGTFNAVVGIVQFLLAYDPTPLLRPPGMHFYALYSSVLDRDGIRRVAGTTAHPIEFGVFCAMLLPLAVHVALRASRARQRPGFWWTCVGLLGAGLMFSVSRTAILAVTSAGLVLLLGWPARRRLWTAAAGLGFLVVIQLVSPGLITTFLGLFQNAGQDSSIMYRTHDYDAARQVISQHLLLGRGLGTWYAPKHQVFDNQYVLTLIEIGVIGLLTFLGIFLVAIYAAVRVRYLSHRLPRATETVVADRDLALSLAASLLVVFPTFATFDFTSFPTVTALAFLLVGMSGALLRIVSSDVAGEPPDPYAIV
jgi:O-antigen ligase